MWYEKSKWCSPEVKMSNDTNQDDFKWKDLIGAIQENALYINLAKN